MTCGPTEKPLFFSIVDDHVPTIKVHNKVKSLPWISDDIRKLMKARDFHRRKYKLTGDQCCWDNYKELYVRKQENIYCQAKRSSLEIWPLNIVVNQERSGAR